MEKIKIIWHVIKLAFYAFIIFTCYNGFEYLENNGWKHTDSSRQSKIYSLKTESSTTGVFILGIGSISGEDYYIFYRETSSGGLIREKIKTSECILYEGYDNPKIIEYGEDWTNLNDGKIVETKFSRKDYGNKYLHEIYIPKGTITERVNNININ